MLTTAVSFQFLSRYRLNNPQNLEQPTNCTSLGIIEESQLPWVHIAFKKKEIGQRSACNYSNWNQNVF